MTSRLRKHKPITIQGLSQSTVRGTDANRQARAERMQEFEALAAYANLGNSLDSWRGFRLAWPHFFPDSPSRIELPGFGSLTEWLYAFAENWANLYSAPENRAILTTDGGPRAIPPLLWYRDLLRAVWNRNDSHGAALCALLGFEKQAQAAGVTEMLSTGVWRPLLVPGQSSVSDQMDTNGLPPGQPIVDELTHTIRWEFGCQFQRAVYDLMQNFWLAKVCPQCGKYFIAGKTAQKYCSPRCFGNKKASASLEYYHRKGRFIREGQRNSLKRSARKRGK